MEDENGPEQLRLALEELAQALSALATAMHELKIALLRNQKPQTPPTA